MNKLFLSVVLAGCAFAKSPFDGTWEGKANGLPAIVLSITEHGGKPGGNITFYLLTRPTDNGTWHVDSKETTPLLQPKIDGETLSFEVVHHKFHGSKEFGPNVAMQVELLGGDKAKLGEIVLTRKK